MNDTERSRWIGPVGVVLLIIVIVGVWAWQSNAPAAPEPSGAATTTATYSNDAYGISFTYPDDYALTETDPGNGERRMHLIMLTRKADLPAPVNGEGPPTIELAFYQNNLDNLSALEWMKNDSRSNYKLGDGTYATTTVAGTDAVAYRWSGLYEGATLAFPHKDNMVAATVTYLTPDDENIRVFEDLLSSMALR